MGNMTTKEAVDREREKWGGVAKELDRLFGISAATGDKSRLRDGIAALSAEIGKYMPVLQERTVSAWGQTGPSFSS